MAISKLIHYQDNSYVTSQGTLLEGFETFADWTITGTGASGAGDSTHKKQGLQSLRLNSVSGVVAVATKTISEDLSAVTNFIIWVYVDDTVPMYNFSEFGLYISSTTDFSKYFYVSIYANEDAWAGHFKRHFQTTPWVYYCTIKRRNRNNFLYALAGIEEERARRLR